MGLQLDAETREDGGYDAMRDKRLGVGCSGLETIRREAQGLSSCCFPTDFEFAHSPYSSLLQVGKR